MAGRFELLGIYFCAGFIPGRSGIRVASRAREAAFHFFAAIAHRTSSDGTHLPLTASFQAWIEFRIEASWRTRLWSAAGCSLLAIWRLRRRRIVPSVLQLFSASRGRADSTEARSSPF